MARLAGVWHHSRAHRFFSRTRRDVRQVGLILANRVVELDRLGVPNSFTDGDHTAGLRHGRLRHDGSVGTVDRYSKSGTDLAHASVAHPPQAADQDGD